MDLKVTVGDLLPLGEHVGVAPKAYNRFAGNPPKNVTPEEAFQQEMGFPYETRTTLAVLADDIKPTTPKK